MSVFFAIIIQLTPVWVALALLLAVSLPTRRYTGLYGKLFENPIAIAGLLIVAFWVFCAILADFIVLQGAKDVVASLRKSLPGSRSADVVYILGGDSGGRDIFSRIIHGARLVLPIATMATTLAFIVGITVGLPAGYFGGKLDSLLSFIANAVLSFPVILLFYLIVLLGRGTGIVETLVGVLGFAPVFFLAALLYALHGTGRNNGLLYATILLPFAVLAAKLSLALNIFITLIIILSWVGYFSFMLARSHSPALVRYSSLLIPFAGFIYARIAYGFPDLDLVGTAFASLFGEGLGSESGNTIKAFFSKLFIPNDASLNVFIAVCFASAPGVFRLVRGLTMDTKTRDYVAAAQTRGENAWFIMIVEILPNIRGPLIVDAALRIGYTTILLGVLGFLGLGLGSESADWGAMIDHGRKVMRIYPHMVIPPALALASLVLGLNLLADGLREVSLKD